MGVSRATATALVSGVALGSLLVGAAAASSAAPVAPGASGAFTAHVQPVETPSPTPSTELSATSPASPADPAERPAPAVRTGGSEPTSQRGKPGWVWWAAAAIALGLVVGAVRLWRSMAD